MDGTTCTDGHGRALLRLFMDEYERLMAYFRSRINQREEARDLVHEVYLRLVGIPAERVIDNTRGYLWMVAKSVLCQFLERSGRMPAADIDDPLVEASLGAQPAYDADLDIESRLLVLQQKFPLLPVKCRAVMELKWRHGLQYEEIASRIGISVDTVKKHLKVGLKQLRQQMQGLE